MSESLIIELEVQFSETPDRVWKMLTESAYTRQYMYGCDVRTDWQVGSPINWVGKTEDGQEITYVKGTVTEIDPGKTVVYTMIDPNSDIPDIPENYVHMRYTLTEAAGGTLLTIWQGDFSGVANGEKRHADSEKGWEFVLPMMHKSLENA